MTLLGTVLALWMLMAATLAMAIVVTGYATIPTAAADEQRGPGR